MPFRIGNVAALVAPSIPFLWSASSRASRQTPPAAAILQADYWNPHRVTCGLAPGAPRDAAIRPTARATPGDALRIGVRRTDHEPDMCCHPPRRRLA